jgi:carbonic anhydrase
VIGSSLEDAQKKLDKALKRNLEKQVQKIEEKPIKEEVINQEIAE